MKIVLLYERGAQPDEHIVKVLETGLNAQGFEVFVDRNQNEGVEWAREIKTQIKQAEVVIPLLSQSSLTGETLAYETRLAYEAAQHQSTPRLLPIRVNYVDPLPRPLANILDSTLFTWMSPRNDSQLMETVLNALRPAPPASTFVLPTSLEPVGGAVPLTSEFYVVRPVDEEFRAAIKRGDSIVLVKGARQMGKTSLLARGLQQAREAGARVLLTDFQKLNEAHLTSIETFFLTLAELIADQLDLRVSPEKTWNPRRGPNMNFERFLRREVLGKISSHLVWGLDEVDRLFTRDFGSEVFGLFRSWHNERSLDPTGPWQRLTLAIAYATEAHLFITDMNQSPFNVGTRLTLEDFTFEQVAEINHQYGSPLQDTHEIGRFFRIVGGHPYLVRRGLHEIATHGLSIAALEVQADHDEGLFGDHLNRIRVSLHQDSVLCDALRNVLHQRTCPTAESFYRLRSAGVILGDSAKDVMPRCQLYETYLKRNLL